MANHVQGYLSIRKISEKGQKVWDKIVADLQTHKDGPFGEVHLGHFIFEDFDNDWDFNRMCDEIGAKWAYATDMDEQGMAMYSAWAPCLEFTEIVAKMIGEVDKSVEIVLTYEDEMPNYAGVATYTKDGLDTDNCLEHDEMLGILKEKEPRLVELWDEDAEEWTDEEEAWDLIQDIQWDTIAEWQADNEDWSIR
jgi:hypothetical protein